MSATDYSLDRGLPASPEAERSILGAILLDNSLANEALIALKADHFFLDAHRRIYQRLTEMMEQGTPLDIVSLTVDLMAHKELEAVGGAGYLASLTDGVPRRTSVQHYVSIVIEKANARNFIHSCNAGIALALEQQVNVLDMIEQHNQSIANISAETGGARDIAVPAREFLDKIKADREWLVDGLIEKGSNGFVVAEPKGSKAQPLDAKILTPSGWRLMGSLQVGDDVFGADGTPTRVVGIFPHGIKKCYRVNISDGTSTECTDEHLWTIQSHNAIERGQGYQTMRTEEIANLLSSGKKRSTYLPVCAPIQYPEKQLTVPAYTFGVILGDGGLTGSSVTITSSDQDIIQRIQSELGEDHRIVPYEEYGYRISRQGKHRACGLLIELRELGTMGTKSQDKEIPTIYLHAGIEQRLDLLRGLLDTDGNITIEGKVRFSSTSRRLAEGVQELVHSLGGSASINQNKASYVKNGRRVQCLDVYGVCIKLPREIGCPFFTKRKAIVWEKSTNGLKRSPMRRIVSVEYSRDFDCQCIQVANANGLYVTDHHIVTHNSFWTVALADCLARGEDFLGFKVPRRVRTLVLNAEDNPETTRWRLSSLERHMGYSDELDGWLWMATKEQFPSFKLDRPSDIRDIVATCKKHKIKFLILDVLNVLHDADENDNKEMRRVLSSVNTIQAKAGCQICIVHHYNKSDGQSITKRMRGSSAISGFAEWIVGLDVVDEAAKVRRAQFEIKGGEAPLPVHYQICNMPAGGIRFQVVAEQGEATPKSKRRWE